MKFPKFLPLLSVFFAFSGCFDSFNPHSMGRQVDYPFFILKEPTLVKKIMVPAGTKLVYDESFFKKGEQSNIQSEEKLTDIEFPNNEIFYWAGIPITSINKFYNPEMIGFSVYADFDALKEEEKTKFSELWQSCHSDLAILVKDIDDWSFNTKNVVDISSCGVNKQRYFKEDAEQQKFLDDLYSELMKIDSD